MKILIFPNAVEKVYNIKDFNNVYKNQISEFHN